MPTRTRTRAKPAEDQATMPLEGSADIDTSSGYGDDPKVLDAEQEEQDVVNGEDTFNEKLVETEDDDPSAGNALAGTVAAMTEGQQAAAAELRQFLERMERLGEELKGVRDDMKDVLTEAKGRGYDVAAIRKLLKLRGMDPEKLREQLAVLRTYAGALGIDEELV